MGNWVPVQSVAQPVGGKATYQRRAGSWGHTLSGKAGHLLAALQVDLVLDGLRGPRAEVPLVSLYT